LASTRRVAFSKLEPTSETISLRLPKGLLDDLKVRKNQRDVSYQSLLKVYLAERLSVERDAATRASRRARRALRGEHIASRT
jgi:CopG antitoxin of type II toxin-antitoxin system